jgi:integrase
MTIWASAVRKRGFHDKRASERLARDLEEKSRKIKLGLDDPKEEASRTNAGQPLAKHLGDWTEALASKDTALKHVDLFTVRAKRIVALLAGAKLCDIDPPTNAKRADLSRFKLAFSKWTQGVRLSDLTTDAVQRALATLKWEGVALATCNHYRTAIQGFANWCFETHRSRENRLRGVTGFNAKEERRHDRRTISLEALQRLVTVADRGPAFMGISGPARAICYRLAVATGLRYSELASIIPESFDWQAPSVVVAAAYTKEWRPGDIFPADRLGERPGRLRGHHPRGDAYLPVACRQGSPDVTA